MDPVPSFSPWEDLYNATPAGSRNPNPDPTTPKYNPESPDSMKACSTPSSMYADPSSSAKKSQVSITQYGSPIRTPPSASSERVVHRNAFQPSPTTQAAAMHPNFSPLRPGTPRDFRCSTMGMADPFTPPIAKSSEETLVDQGFTIRSANLKKSDSDLQAYVKRIKSDKVAAAAEAKLDEERRAATLCNYAMHAHLENPGMFGVTTTISARPNCHEEREAREKKRKAKAKVDPPVTPENKVRSAEGRVGAHPPFQVPISQEGFFVHIEVDDMLALNEGLGMIIELSQTIAEAHKRGELAEYYIMSETSRLKYIFDCAIARLIPGRSSFFRFACFKLLIAEAQNVWYLNSPPEEIPLNTAAKEAWEAICRFDDNDMWANHPNILFVKRRVMGLRSIKAHELWNGRGNRQDESWETRMERTYQY